jgi:hypothetical protein
MVRKGLTFGQYAHYNLLSSKTHQSFSTVFYFGRFLGILAEFDEFFAVVVIAHFMPPVILSIEKLVSTYDQPSCHERETCVYWNSCNLN